MRSTGTPESTISVPDRSKLQPPKKEPSLVKRLCALVIAFVSCTLAAGAAEPVKLDRAFVIIMENADFADIVGPATAAPGVTKLAREHGVDTEYYGTTHPSLPNYLSMLGGQTFGVTNDAPSCFAPGAGAGCHAVDAPNVIDQLETHGVSWAVYEQAMPQAGFLGAQFPTSGPGSGAYAQKHNPFVYFRSVATDPKRLAKIQPMPSDAALQAVLADPITAPKMIWLVPDQCHDMHGTHACPDVDAYRHVGDETAVALVKTIVASPAYTAKSAIFLVWDEGDTTVGCCGANGGGRTPMIVITPQVRGPRMSAVHADHYSLLATLEDAFGLPRLGQAANRTSLADLLR